MNELDTIKGVEGVEGVEGVKEKMIEVVFKKEANGSITGTIEGQNFRPFSEIRKEGRALGLKGKDLTDYVEKHSKGTEPSHNLFVKALIQRGTQFRLDKVCADTTLRFSAGAPVKIKKPSKTAQLEAEIARLKALIPAE